MGFLSNLFRSDEVDPEARNRTLIITGIGAIMLFAVVLVGVGYYMDRVVPRNETVFSVGERDFSYAYLEDRVAADAASGAITQANFEQGVGSTIANIQREELIRLKARDMGFTATSEEIDQTMRENLGAPGDLGRNEFAAILRDELQALGMSLERYRDRVEADVLRSKLEDSLAEDLPSEIEQVDLLLIQTDNQAATLDARDRLEAGEPFADVATELSVHPTRAEGGEVGWVPQDLLPEDLQEEAFTLEGRSEVIEVESGFYILEVRGTEVRPLDENQTEDLLNARLNDLIDAASEEYEVTTELTNRQLQDLASNVGSAIRG